MATPSRTAQIAKLHKVLKKHYGPVLPDRERSVLEHLLFACCLENAHYAAAEESLAALTHTFYDWNEVRVSTVRELSESMPNLPDPQAAAGRVRRVLQSVFEATYSFDLEEIKKLNLKPATERLEKIDGASKFCLDYVVHAALGGHAIPIDSGTFGALGVVNLVTAKDVKEHTVPGLERAISKNEGAEFASLLHQLGADFAANPYAHSLHALLLEIDPTAKERLPSRRAAKKEEEAAAAAALAKRAEAKAAREAERGKLLSKEAAKPAGKEHPKPSGKEAVKPAETSKAVSAKPAVKEPGKTAGKEPAKEAMKAKAKDAIEPPAKTPAAKEPARGDAKRKPAEAPPTAKPAAETPPKPVVRPKHKAPAKETAPPPKSVERPPKGVAKKPEAAKGKSGDASSPEGLAKRKPR